MNAIACPKCGARTGVSETRARDTLRRRRKCRGCGHSFWTVELYETDAQQLERLLAAMRQFIESEARR